MKGKKSKPPLPWGPKLAKPARGKLGGTTLRPPKPKRLPPPPRIPRPTGPMACPTCEGIKTYGPTLPGDDPGHYRVVECPDCKGEGTVSAALAEAIRSRPHKPAP